MTDIITIPLDRLVAWKGNVRKTGTQEGIDELAASIAAHGLLQSLVVRPTKNGKYEVIAGRRRFLALTALTKSGRLPKKHPVNCIVASENMDATELSLAENVMRMPMHPIDQLEAFHAIVDAGATAADVASRFGVTELLVNRRLKLARLSPMILDAYRNEEIDLETAQAFTITDDHAAQERVYTALPEWNRTAHAIKRALTEDEVPSTDKRVRFVGLECYRAAGGTVRQDLFNDKDEGYLSDTELLDQLVQDKLRLAADTIKQEGWLWVETAIDLDYAATNHFTRAYPEEAELSDADQAELEALTAEYEQLDSDDEPDTQRLDEIDKRIDLLTESTKKWPTSILNQAGAILSLDHRGEVRVERGLIRPEDRSEEAAPWDNDPPSASRPTHRISASLMAELTAQRTAAISVELLRRPAIALAAIVHRLALTTFYPGAATGSCVQLSIQQTPLASWIAKSSDCRPINERDDHGSSLQSTLPSHPDDLWQWCLDRSTDELLSLLAYLAALSVNAVQTAHDRPDCDRLKHANDLAEALQLDMGKWFTPTAQNYFSRVNRNLIMTAIDEAQGGHGPALDKLKKGELAIRAEAIVATANWLPHPLRNQTAGQGSDDISDAA